MITFLKNCGVSLTLWTKTLSLILVGTLTQLSAQIPQGVTRMPISEETPPMTTFEKNISIGLNVGLSNGIGLDVAYRFNPKLSARLAYNYASYTLNDFQYTLAVKASDPTGAKPQTFSFDVAANFSNLQLGIEYALGAKGRFRLLGGLAYFPTNQLKGSGELVSVIRFKDVELNSDDVGNGSVTMGFASPIAPYLGIGFGRLHPRKRLNLSVDMGAYYKGNYKFGIDVSDDGLIQPQNEENAAILDRNFNAQFLNKIWPILNLRLAYRLK